MGWTEQSPSGTAVLTVRRDPTLFGAIAQYGAEQEQLAAAHAPISGFRNYALLENHAQPPCAGDSTERWYVKIRGDYRGTPAVAELVLFIRDGTLFSAGYLRPLNVAEDPRAVIAVQALCPGQVRGAQPRGVVDVAGTVGGSVTIVVNGVSLTTQDTVELYGLIIKSVSSLRAPVVKNPDEMPAYAPDITYAGKNTAGQTVVWSTRAFEADFGRTSGGAQEKLYREMIATALAGGLDQGQGDSTLQSFARERTPAGLMTVGFAFVDAIQLAESETIANSRATQVWVAGHITRGMTRQSVAAALSAKGITSTSPVRANTNCEADMVTHSWYEGNYPYSECGFVSAAHPVIRVTLPWPLEPGCTFSSSLDVLFDDSDRVQRLALSNPVPACL